MLNAVKADHFEPVVGQAIDVAGDGFVVSLVVESVRRHPAARLPEDPPETREPFSVVLTGRPDVPFVAAECTFELPGLGRLENVQVGRIAPLSREPGKAYFQIIFN